MNRAPASLPPFHLAFPVSDLDATRRFYGQVLGCRMGRSAERWVDFELYGHQISAHLRRAEPTAQAGQPGPTPPSHSDRVDTAPPETGGETGGDPRPGVALHNPVDGKQVPVPHFGAILPWDDWQALAERLQAAEVEFVIEPYVRFAGEPGEQGTLFVLDPSGNALEFKSFRDPSKIFATD